MAKIAQLQEKVQSELSAALHKKTELNERMTELSEQLNALKGMQTRKELEDKLKTLTSERESLMQSIQDLSAKWEQEFQTAKQYDVFEVCYEIDSQLGIQNGKIKALQDGQSFFVVVSIEIIE